MNLTLNIRCRESKRRESRKMEIWEEKRQDVGRKGTGSMVLITGTMKPKKRRAVMAE